MMNSRLIGYVVGSGNGGMKPAGVKRGMNKAIVLQSVVAACSALGVGVFLAQDAKPAQAAVSLTGTSYSENFDGSLANSSSAAFSATIGVQGAIPGTSGWDATKVAGTGTAAMPYTVDAGSGLSGGIYSWGNSTSSAERALGTIASGSNTPAMGVEFVNNTGGTINAVTISFTAEFWRSSTTATNTDVFGYLVGASGSTNYLSTAVGVSANTNLDIVGPAPVGSNGALDGNAAGNQSLRTATLSGLSWAAGTSLYLRWTDFNDAGNDAGLGIDGFTLNVVGVPTWTGNGTDANWGTAANWNTAPVNGDPVVFTGTTQTTNTNNSLTSVNSITFDAAAGAFTLNGNGLSIASGITNSSTSSQVINLDVTLTSTEAVTAVGNVALNGNLSLGSNTMVVSGAGNVSINGNVSASGGGINKSGAGTLVFNSPSAVSIGVLTLGGGGVTIGAGQSVSSNFGTTGNVTWDSTSLTGNGTLNLNIDFVPSSSQASLILGASMNGTGFSGNVNITGGGQLNVRSTLNPLGTGNITIQTSGFQLITTGGFIGSPNFGSLTNHIILAGSDDTFTLFAAAVNSGGTSSQTNTLTLGPISGTGRLVIQSNTQPSNGSASSSSTGGGGGLLQLGGASTYTGDTIMNLSNTGSVKLLVDSALPSGTNLKFGVLAFDGATPNPGFGGVLDLNGHNVQVASISNGTGAIGSITNSSTTAGTLTVSGGTSTTFDLALTGNLGLSKSGASSLTLTASQSYSGNTNVNAGSLVTFGDGTNTTSSVIGTVSGAGNVTVAAQSTVTAKKIVTGNLTVNGKLNIAAASDGGKVNNLSIAGAPATAGGWTGKIDLVDNAIGVQTTGAGDKATKIATLADQIKSGHGVGNDWLGTGGITSSVAAAAATGFGSKAVGLFVNSDLTTPLSTLDGGASIDLTTVFVGVSFNGDANFDGKVDLVDLTAIANHWQTNQNNWAVGDINLDGFVDINDLTAVANNWQAGVGPGFTGQSFGAAVAQAFGAVPEPTSLGLLGLGGLAMLRRRRR